jgi:hypothetical protein
MGRPGRPVLLDGSKLKREQAQASNARVGSWPRQRLERMNEKFVARLERAIERGEEQRPDADRRAPRAGRPAASAS